LHTLFFYVPDLLEKDEFMCQNARSKNETNRAEDIEEKVVEDGKEGDIDAVEVKKRKRDGKEEQFELEQVNEMNKLQNFLFGCLYSPLESGKGGDDESAAKVASDLFFTDRSADSVLSSYQEDADLSDESGDDAFKRKQPVWVDEEEEKVTVNIAKVNRLRKLRKEENEIVITGF
jgi:U3 small nucleolar RNA-associated protein 18